MAMPLYICAGMAIRNSMVAPIGKIRMGENLPLNRFRSLLSFLFIVFLITDWLQPLVGCFLARNLYC